MLQKAAACPNSANSSDTCFDIDNNPDTPMQLMCTAPDVAATKRCYQEKLKESVCSLERNYGVLQDSLIANVGAGSAMYSCVPSTMQAEPTRGSTTMIEDTPPGFSPGTCTKDTFEATKDPSVPSFPHSSPGQRLQGAPGKDAALVDRLDYLHAQLDSFDAKNPLMRRFVLLGHSHRRHGGVIH